MNAGIFPFRTPIHSVVGSPVEVDKKYTEEEINADNGAVLNKYHDLYLKALQEIHDQWKPVFDKEKKERRAELEADAERKKVLDDKKFQNLRKTSQDLKIK